MGDNQTGLTDAFVGRFTPQGTIDWIQQIGVSGEKTEANAITVDGAGDFIYLVGETSGMLNNENITGVKDMFILAANGHLNNASLRWVKNVGHVGKETEGFGAALDSATMGVVVCGETEGIHLTNFDKKV